MPRSAPPCPLESLGLRIDMNTIVAIGVMLVVVSVLALVIVVEFFPRLLPPEHYCRILHLGRHHSTELYAKCIMNLAIQYQDFSTCDKIPYQEHGLKHGCYLCVSEAKQDLSACDRIEDQWLKEQCVLGYYVGLAKARQDVSACDGLEDWSTKSRCYKIVRVDLECGNPLDNPDYSKCYSQIHFPNLQNPS